MAGTPAATTERPRDGRGRYVKDKKTNRTRRGINAPVTLRFNDGYPILFARLDDMGHTSNSAKASQLHCGEATVSRMRHGEQGAGPDVIASTVVLFPGDDLSTFFDFNAGVVR